MPKKSAKSITPKIALQGLSDEEISSSMLLYISDDERVYLHPFDTDIQALEFLETMVAGLRADILEQIMKRSLN